MQWKFFEQGSEKNKEAIQTTLIVHFFNLGNIQKCFSYYIRWNLWIFYFLSTMVLLQVATTILPPYSPTIQYQ